MLTALAPAVQNEQVVMPKSMVPDLEQFNGDRTKFEDLWKGICLFLKSNRATAIDDKITAMLVHLRGGIAGIYAQKRSDQIEDKEDTQDQNKFVKSLSKNSRQHLINKSKTVDTEWKIEVFKQEKRYIADFIIEFKVLPMKAETDNLHTIFLLKKNV